MPANLYGPGDKYSETNSHVVAALIDRFHKAKLANAPSVEIWGTGKARREFLHCDDMADACIFLMENYNSPDVINVGTGVDSTILELAHLIADVIGYTGQITLDKSRPDGMPRKVVDVSKLEAMGWKSKIELKEGLASTYQAYITKYS